MGWMEDFAFHLQNLNIGEQVATGAFWYFYTYLE
jgi:hypothetical protein